MILQEFLPPPAFRHLVQWYRIVHFEFNSLPDAYVKVFAPKPETNLYFMLKGPLAIESEKDGLQYLQEPLLLGQQTTVNRRYHRRSFLNFQIVFQPAGLFRLTGVPAHEFTDNIFPAEDFLGRGVWRMQEELLEAKNYPGMLSAADRFVAELVAGARETETTDHLGEFIIGRAGDISLDRLARQAYLSQKQFVRKFLLRTGVTPKTYARIARFNKAFNLRNAYPHYDWLRIAVESNCADYQHLAKEYKHFTGLTPTEFHRFEQESPESRLQLTKNIYRSRAGGFPQIA